MPRIKANILFSQVYKKYHKILPGVKKIAGLTFLTSLYEKNIHAANLKTFYLETFI